MVRAYFKGAVAQLGERMTGSHEARGSNPLSSTNLYTTNRHAAMRAGFLLPWRLNMIHLKKYPLLFF